MPDKAKPDPPSTPSPRGDPGRPVVTGMVGHGFYDRHSSPQRAGIDYLLPWLEQAIGAMPLDDGAPAVGLADIGCSEGRNSLLAMERLVAAVRLRGDRPIQTIFIDLPTNDFSKLLTKLRPGGGSPFETPETYSAVVAGSMYEQLLPPRSLHLATSFNTIGYLSRRPLERLPHYVLAHGPSVPDAAGSVSPADREVFAAQARDDMARFLKARAAELVPGGALLVETFGAGEAWRNCDRIHDALNDAMLAAVEQDIIERADYEAYYSPLYYRTLEELTSLVATADAPLGALFRLERAETFEVPVPFVEDFQRDGDAGPFARDYSNFFRAFTEGLMRTAFAEHPNVDRLIAEVFARIERLLREDPGHYEFHYIMVAALLTRL